MSDAYREFLESKIVSAPEDGFHVDLADLNPWLKPHAAAIVQWGLKGGRRAYFTAYGLHKTSMQIETEHQVLKRFGGMGLIVIPLGVRLEFWNDAERMDYDKPRFIRTTAEADAPGIYLTNYESVRDGKIDPSAFIVACLDEADVLRSYGSKTFQTFLPLFDGVRFRFVATATPDPNRHKELIHYAGFLGVMDTGQALTRFFQRNPEKAGDLQLFPHKVDEFWIWVHSWAIFLQRPSDLGFSDEGYEQPPLIVRWHEVQTDLSGAGEEKDGQQRLIRDAAIGVADAAREKRGSLQARIAKLAELRSAEPENHFLLWHDLEDERRAIEAAVPAAVSVFGSQDLEDREAAVLGFKAGTVTDLAAKPVMLGGGVSLQAHCHRAIFAGIGFKFRDFIQAIHRIRRFGQTEPVIIDLIYAETERETRRILETKWARDTDQRQVMTEIIRAHGLDHLPGVRSLARTIGADRKEAAGETWRAVLNDCVDETACMAESAVDLIVTSVPFGTQYEYCESYNDFGHNADNAGFWRQMDYLTPQLLRVLAPGRLAAVHVKDRIRFGAVTGFGRPTVEPFHADCIAHFIRHGWLYMGLRFVQTDVVRENNQTYRLGYSEMRKDATKMGAGSPEFVLLFAKPQTDLTRGYADTPVTKDAADYSLARWQIDADAFWRSSGDRLMSADELATLPPETLARAFRAQSLRTVYDHAAHVATGEALEAKGALPKTFSAIGLGSWAEDAWHDILRMRTLNADQSLGRRELHVCPLQIDIVERLIRLYSNKGDLVFDPFMGIGTVPVEAVKLGRRGLGSELNAQYFADAVRYLTLAERDVSAPTLFDLDALERAA